MSNPTTDEEPRRSSFGLTTDRPPSQNFAVASGQPQQEPQQATPFLFAAAPPLLPPQAPASSESGSMWQVINLLQQQLAQMQQWMVQSQGNVGPQHVRPALHNPELVVNALADSICEFRYDAEAGVTFAAWYARFEDLFAHDAARLDDATKTRLLARKLGTAEHSRFSSFILPRAPHDLSFAETVDTLKGLFGSKESLLCRRFKCFNTIRSSGEDLLAFTCKVNRACVEAELASMTEEHLKCLVLVSGLRQESDRDIRVKLLARMEREPDVTLQQLAEEGVRISALKQDSAMIEGPSTEQILAVTAAGDQRTRNPPRGEAPKTPCWLCGELHWARDCPFKSSTCEDCGEVGHKKGFCQTSRPRRRFGARNRHAQTGVRLVTVNVRSICKRRRFVSLQIGGLPIEMQLDTASDITLIDREAWKGLGCPCLQPPSVLARSASGANVRLDGEFTTTVTLNDRSAPAIIRVSNVRLLLLGADVMDALGLWALPIETFCRTLAVSPNHTSGSWQEQFPKVFSGTGLCTRANIQIALRADCVPVFRPKRPVAYAIREAVNEELDRLQKLNVITPVTSSDWAAPVVVVRKASGAIRLCGDYSTGLNDALLPYEYPLPLPEDIFARLANCKVFTKIDLSDAFLQVEIAPQYRKLLTIHTHRGLYTYNRLPPGVKIAPAAFQQLIDTMLAGIPGVSGYLDDIIIGGTTVQQHDVAVAEVLKRIREYGLTLRPEKCVFCTETIQYLGHVIDSNGLRPNPEKIEAIRNLPEPANIADVRAFLGAVNYYGKFVPKMRELRHPLDELLKPDTQFRWTAECRRAFLQFKEILSSDLLLAHYDPRQEIVVSADASSVGVGATLSHVYRDGSVRVVQHAARSLTKAEQQYSQIDREALAIIFAVKKFHKMVFGRHFRLQTDHQPLLRIFGAKSGIPTHTANRLQRFALFLLSYNFRIEYVRSENFGNADVLSRLIKSHTKADEDCVIAFLEADVKECAVKALESVPLTLAEVAQETKADPLLGKTYRYVQNGWPSGTYEGELSRLHARRDALSTVDGCLLYGERVVIPQKLQHKCLLQAHRGHPGMVRMKALARSYFYWPSMDHEIEEWVRSCQACQLGAKAPARIDPSPWPESTEPWQRVHVDYAGPVGSDYFLVVVDAFSKWPEIFRTSITTATSTIELLRGLFARFGAPVTLVSDNGTQFASAEFESYCGRNGILHVRTPPYHPQSNGQAERFVDTFKRTVKKIAADGCSLNEALDTFLLTYRSTPCPTLGLRTPAEAMLGRKLRTSLELLRPHDRPALREESKVARSYRPGDLIYAKVYSRNTWKWLAGIVSARVGRVIYKITTEDGSTIRRHVNQLRTRAQDVSHAAASSHPEDLLLEDLFTEGNLSAPDTMLAPVTPPAPISVTPTVPVAPTALAVIPTSSPPAAPTALATIPASSPTEPPERAGGTMQPVQQPRRSSRTRKVPRRFEMYRADI